MAQPAITVDIRATTRALDTVTRRIPVAGRWMVNDLAGQVMKGERAAFKTTFKSPRPFTANSVFFEPAPTGSMTSTAYVRSEAATYLQPYETGGVHVLPGTALLNPKGIQLDKYGQLVKGTMGRLKGRQDIYIGPVDTKKAGTIVGVWQRLLVTRTGKARRNRGKRGRGRIYHPVLGRLKLLIRFGDALPVNLHLDFVPRAVTLVTANAQAAWDKAWAKVMS